MLVVRTYVFVVWRYGTREGKRNQMSDFDINCGSIVVQSTSYCSKCTSWSCWQSQTLRKLFKEGLSRFKLPIMGLSICRNSIRRVGQAVDRNGIGKCVGSGSKSDIQCLWWYLLNALTDGDFVVLVATAGQLMLVSKCDCHCGTVGGDAILSNEPTKLC